jgi:DNA repair protein RAD16
LNPISKHGLNNPAGQESMRILRCILQRIMLRRTKTEKADDLCLPPRIIRIRNDQLDEEENDFYEALYKQVSLYFYYFILFVESQRQSSWDMLLKELR